MEHQERAGSILPLSVVIVVMGLGGYLLYDRPFINLRPEDPREVPREHESTQDVETRLWEDPLAAVHRGGGTSLCEPSYEDHRPDARVTSVAARRDHEIWRLAFELKERADQARGRSDTAIAVAHEAPRVLLMPVLIRDEPYSEAAESRRRVRYAVLSGLEAAGYVPETPEALGYIDTCWNAQDHLEARGSRKVVAAYEWFVPDALRAPTEQGWAASVLVLWLGTGDFSIRPLHRIDELLRNLVSLGDGAGAAKDAGSLEGPLDAYAFRLIGPATSDGLLTMLEEPPNQPRNPLTSRSDTGSTSPESELDTSTGQSESGAWSPETLALELLQEACNQPGPLSEEFEHLPASIDRFRGEVHKETPRRDWARWEAELVTELAKAPGFQKDDEVDTCFLTGEEKVREWVARHRYRVFMEPRPPKTILDRLTIYSTRASAAPSLLLQTAELLGDRRRDSGSSLVARFANAHGVRFVPVIPTDDRLAEEVVGELERRGVDLCERSGEGHLVMVGEWDTFYGRALPVALEAAVFHCRQGKDRGPETLDTAVQSVLVGQSAFNSRDTRLHRFTYMRGLDGSSISGDGEEGDQGRGRAGEGNDQEDRGERGRRFRLERRPDALERAVGDGQLDTMRRLAAQLEGLDRDLTRSGEGIRAIGVVGTDLYDKLLVLQALRARFPRAIFFTTALDARLLHPAEYPWTRNLIVASGFGLSLGRDLQHRIPPFRDGYQTATFLGVQMALAHLSWDPPRLPRSYTAERVLVPATSGAAIPRFDPSSSSPRPVGPRLAALEAGLWLSPSEAAITPRLYEIGRSRPHDLSPTEDTSEVHPRRMPAGPPPKRVLTVASSLLFALVLLIPVVPAFRRNTLARAQALPQERAWRARAELAWVTALALVAVFAVVVWREFRSLTGEPFELFEGISIWPTEILRLLAGFLSVGLIVHGFTKLQRNTAALTRRYGLPGGRRDRAGLWRRWWRNRGAAGEPPQAPAMTLQGLLGRGWRAIGRERALWWQNRRGVSINEWGPAGAAADPCAEDAPDSDRVPEAGTVWDEYLERARLSHRLTRFIPVALVYFLMGATLVNIFGRPHRPYRGEASLWIDQSVLYLSVLGMILLTFFVVDATRLCERFIKRLCHRTIRWPEGAMARIEERRGVRGEAASELLAAEVISERTEAVGSLILYPFVILSLMLVSRMKFFDGWDWPWSLILIFGLGSAYAVTCAVVLRRAAEQARRVFLDRLREQLCKVFGSARPGGDDLVEPAGAESSSGDGGASQRQLELLIREVEGLQRGAFGHWSRNPLIRALMLPFGGLGAMALLDLLGSVGF